MAYYKDLSPCKYYDDERYPININSSSGWGFNLGFSHELIVSIILLYLLFFKLNAFFSFFFSKCSSSFSASSFVLWIVPSAWCGGEYNE